MGFAGALIRETLFEWRGAAAWPLGWLALGVAALLSTAPSALACAALPSTRAAQRASAWPAHQLGRSFAGHFLFGAGYIVYMTFVLTWLATRGGSAREVAAVWSAARFAAIMASPWSWGRMLRDGRGGAPLATSIFVLAAGAALPLWSTAWPLMVAVGGARRQRGDDSRCSVGGLRAPLRAPAWGRCGVGHLFGGVCCRPVPRAGAGRFHRRCERLVVGRARAVRPALLLARRGAGVAPARVGVMQRDAAAAFAATEGAGGRAARARERPGGHRGAGALRAAQPQRPALAPLRRGQRRQGLVGAAQLRRNSDGSHELASLVVLAAGPRSRHRRAHDRSAVDGRRGRVFAVTRRANVARFARWGFVEIDARDAARDVQRAA